MRVRQGWWTVLALLAATGVALLVRGQGPTGSRQGAIWRTEAQDGTGPALEGLARPVRAESQPLAPAPTADPAQRLAPTDDGETYSIPATSGMAQLTVRLTAWGTGARVHVQRWIASGNVWEVPADRTLSLPALPSGKVRLELASPRGSDGTWRLLCEYLVLDVPEELPSEIDARVPLLADLPSDQVVVVPVDAETGSELVGGVWHPPPELPDLRPIAADIRGRIGIPWSALHRAMLDEQSPLAAISLGLMVPGCGEPSAHSSVRLRTLQHFARGGELLILLRALSARIPACRVALIAADGSPAAGVRAVTGALRLVSDVRGLLAWHASLHEYAPLYVYDPDGRVWDALEVESGIAPGAEPARVVLPRLAHVELEFNLPLEAPGGDGRGTARLFLWPPTRALQGAHGLFSNPPIKLDLKAPRVQTRLPIDREIELGAVVEGVPTLGSTLWSGFTFVLYGSERRLVIDWPPTRILSRHDR